MKSFVIAAGLAVAAAFVPAAGAQVHRTVTTHTEVHSHTGPAVAHHGTRKVCSTSIHNHRKVQTCHMVRY